MRIAYWLMTGSIVVVLGAPLFASEIKTVDEKKQEQAAAFVKTMKTFVRAEGLAGKIQPGYVCRNGKEVCGPTTGNLEQLLKKGDYAVLKISRRLPVGIQP